MRIAHSPSLLQARGEVARPTASRGGGAGPRRARPTRHMTAQEYDLDARGAPSTADGAGGRTSTSAPHSLTGGRIQAGSQAKMKRPHLRSRHVSSLTHACVCIYVGVAQVQTHNLMLSILHNTMAVSMPLDQVYMGLV